MAARTPTVQPKTGPGSFDAFFHPEKLAAGEEASASPAPTLKPLVPPPVLRTPTAPAGSSASSGKVDVNTASSAELLEVPGIGPVLAQRIIDGRPYQSADDLMKVKGIGPKIYARIRDHFR